MHTGTLIDDLFQAVEKAEKDAARLWRASQDAEKAILSGTGVPADEHSKRDSEAE